MAGLNPQVLARIIVASSYALYAILQVRPCLGRARSLDPQNLLSNTWQSSTSCLPTLHAFKVYYCASDWIPPCRHSILLWVERSLTLSTCNIHIVDVESCPTPLLVRIQPVIWCTPQQTGIDRKSLLSSGRAIWNAMHVIIIPSTQLLEWLPRRQ